MDGKEPLRTPLAFLAGGAEPNEARRDGWTPLHEAAYYGHKDVVQLLLMRGADHNSVTHLGTTPLSLALRQGHTGVINILQDA